MEEQIRDENYQNNDSESHIVKTTSMQSINLPLTNNLEAFNFGKNAPPDYEKTRTLKNASTSHSLFKSIEYAKDQSKGGYRLIKKLTTLFCCSFTITVILLILMAVPITMIVIGSLYVKDCSFQIMIPIWLIVSGALSIIKNLSTLIQRIKALNNVESTSTFINVFDSFMTLFLIVWFLCGNYWVYHDNSLIQYTNRELETTYCDKTTYLFSFWLITSIYMLIGAGILVFCFTVCCTIFIPTRN